MAAHETSTSDGFQIQLANPSDARHFEEAVSLIFDSDCHALYGVSAEALLMSPHHQVYCYRRKKIVIGLVILTDDVLHSLGIIPAFRGQNLSDVFLRAVLRDRDVKGLGRLCTAVDPAIHGAKKRFIKLGFVEMPGHLHGHLILRWTQNLEDYTAAE